MRPHPRVLLATAGLAAVALTVAPTVGSAPSGGVDASATPAVRSHAVLESVSVRAGVPSDATPEEIDITPADCLSDYGYACQTPDSVQSAYDIPDTIGGRPAGSGRTIVIVSPYGSPTIASDLAAFDDDFGLPSTHLSVLYPGGPVDFDPTDQDELGWAGETSLDVEWAHAVAPGADIDLVVAASDADDDLVRAEQYAIDHHLGDVLSLSFGEPEALIRGDSADQDQAHSAYLTARRLGMTVVAAAGDNGSDNGLGTPNPSFPASDPLVTAVGGTTLFAGTGVAGPRETTWGDLHGCPFGCAAGPFGATGGAPSRLTGKAGTDVAYDADPYTGFVVQEGFYPDPSLDGTYFVGGTSAGAPQWAGIVADLDQAAGHDLGSLESSLPAWAARGGLSDITVGDNETPTYQRGYSAGRGDDVPTGYGTPDVATLLELVSSRPTFGWTAFPSWWGDLTSAGNHLGLPSGWPGSYGGWFSGKGLGFGFGHSKGNGHH